MVSIIYGATIAVRDRLVAGIGWHAQVEGQHSGSATPADRLRADSAAAVLAFADAGAKDGRLSLAEFVAATAKMPQV